MLAHNRSVAIARKDKLTKSMRHAAVGCIWNTEAAQTAEKTNFATIYFDLSHTFSSLIYVFAIFLWHGAPWTMHPLRQPHDFDLPMDCKRNSRVNRNSMQLKRQKVREREGSWNWKHIPWMVSKSMIIRCTKITTKDERQQKINPFNRLVET